MENGLQRIGGGISLVITIGIIWLIGSSLDGIINIITIIITIGIMGSIYIAPYLIAIEKKVKNKNILLWVNLLLGWTIIGRIFCIFRALLGSKSEDKKK